MTEEGPKESKLIDQWVRREPRVQHTTFGQRYSYLVRQLKLLIVVGAIFLMGYLVIWPLFLVEDKTFNLAVSDMKPEFVDETQEDVSSRMAAPRYQGVDKNGQPYSIQAEQAHQIDKENVELETISGKATLSDKTQMNLTADRGKININSKYLELRDNVKLISDNGYAMHSEKADVNFGARTAEGDAEVLLEGPTGTLHASGFKLKNNGDEIDFTGPVKLIIKQ